MKIKNVTVLARLKPVRSEMRTVTRPAGSYWTGPRRLPGTAWRALAAPGARARWRGRRRLAGGQMVTGAGAKRPTRHQEHAATPEPTGRAREIGAPRGGRCSPASTGCSRWSAASRRSSTAWRLPTARGASPRGVRHE
jgi:hypothetical protein